MALTVLRFVAPHHTAVLVCVGGRQCQLLSSRILSRRRLLTSLTATPRSDRDPTARGIVNHIIPFVLCLCEVGLPLGADAQPVVPMARVAGCVERSLELPPRARAGQ